MTFPTNQKVLASLDGLRTYTSVMASLSCNWANRSKLLAAAARTLVPPPVYPDTDRVRFCEDAVAVLVGDDTPNPAPLEVFFFGLAWS